MSLFDEVEESINIGWTDIMQWLCEGEYDAYRHYLLHQLEIADVTLRKALREQHQILGAEGPDYMNYLFKRRHILVESLDWANGTTEGVKKLLHNSTNQASAIILILILEEHYDKVDFLERDLKAVEEEMEVIEDIWRTKGNRPAGLITASSIYSAQENRASG